MDKRIINVDTDKSQSSEVARAFGHKGEMSAYTWVDEATGTRMPWPPSEPAPGCMDAPPLVPTTEAVERWGNQWWRLVHSDGSAVEPPSDTLQVVMVCGDGYFYEQGNDTTQEFVDDGRWLGPVLERPVGKEA